MEKLIFILLITIMLSACSSEQLKRSTYGAIDNLHRQQCYKEMGSNCEKRESYDTYQDRREELETSK